MSLRLSLTLFGLPLDDYASIAATAEASGYDAIWLADHLVTPVQWEPTYPYHESGRPTGYGSHTPLADVWVTLGHLSCVTSRMSLGTGVYILPLRNPFVSARAAATVQQLSGGRLLLGVGAGWLPEEYAAVGESFEDRGARMDEIVDIMRKLWTGAPVEHRGEHYRFEAVQMSPPAQPAPPIVMGGITRSALQRAARLGDGWFGPVCTLEASMAARAAIEDQRHALGRGHLPFRYWVRLTEPWNPAARDALLRAGFEDAVISLGQVVEVGRGGGAAAVAEGIARLAEEING